MANKVEEAFKRYRKDYPYAHPVQDAVHFQGGYQMALDDNRHALDLLSEVESAIINIREQIIKGSEVGFNYKTDNSWCMPLFESNGDTIEILRKIKALKGE